MTIIDNPHDLPASLAALPGEHCPRCTELEQLLEKAIKALNETAELLEEANDNVQSWRNMAKHHQARIAILEDQIACLKRQVATGRAHGVKLYDTEPD